MLTEKAKEDFEKWYIPLIRQREDIQDRYFDENLLSMIYRSGDLVLNTFITAWFDSIGIFITPKVIENNCWIYTIEKISIGESVDIIKSITIMDGFKNRKAATEAAIKQVNEIYNSKNNLRTLWKFME